MIDRPTFDRLFAELLAQQKLVCSGPWKPREFNGIQYDGSEARCHFLKDYEPCVCGDSIFELTNTIIRIEGRDELAAVLEAERIAHASGDHCWQVMVATPREWTREERLEHLLSTIRYDEALKKVNVPIPLTPEELRIRKDLGLDELEMKSAKHTLPSN